MPIKTQNGKVESFAGEVDPRDRLRRRAPDSPPRPPYFIGDWSDEEKQPWTAMYQADVKLNGSYI